MTAGKPPAKPTDAQRDAFNAKFNEDAKQLGKDVGARALQAALEHMKDNPDSLVTQMVQQIEHDTGAFSVLARHLRKLADESKAARGTKK